MKKNKRSGKAFLSDSTKEFGSIAWYVIANDRGVTDRWIESEVRLSDCSRNITLNMGVSVACASMTDEEERHEAINERLEKIDTLIDQLTQFKASYQEALSKLL
jgi:hypothetical protein